MCVGFQFANANLLFYQSVCGVIYICIIQQFSLKYVFFKSTLLILCKPLRNWTFQRFAGAAQKKGRNGTNKKIWHSLGHEPRSSAYLAPIPYPLSYGCQWAELNFFPYKLSNLKFTPLPSLHVDFAYFSNNVDSKRHIIIRTAILYNQINSGQIMKNTKWQHVEISPHEGKAAEWI